MRRGAPSGRHTWAPATSLAEHDHVRAQPRMGRALQAARYVVARHSLARAALLGNGARGGGHAARGVGGIQHTALEVTSGDGNRLFFLLVRSCTIALGSVARLEGQRSREAMRWMAWRDLGIFVRGIVSLVLSGMGMAGYGYGYGYGYGLWVRMDSGQMNKFRRSENYFTPKYFFLRPASESPNVIPYLVIPIPGHTHTWWSYPYLAVSIFIPIPGSFTIDTMSIPTHRYGPGMRYGWVSV